MSRIDEINSILQRARNEFEPYIRHIRFPHYKQIFDGERIDFDFPLTVLVGPNGCNKSSVLQALYGCPRGNNTGRYWFSTDVDVITDDGGRHCCIHGYYSRGADTVVESLKTRISKTTDPDYWEPSRPLMEYGMMRMPDIEPDAPLIDRSRTRWNAIEKNVLYLDFRSEIGAYDKYFWYGDFRRTERMRTKQDYIRKRSRLLRTVINGNLETYGYYNKNRIKNNTLLSPDACGVVSNILGQAYESVRVIEHSFYGGQFGKTVILDRADLEYSEAFAGSGETSVAVLVHEIMSAPDKSLILLDEPETSLHPKAQQKLQDFLLSQIISRKHQIIISTHSPSIINNLPQEAVKIMYVNPMDNKVRILPKSFPEEAFEVIGFTDADKLKIYVEDSLTEAIVKIYIQRFKSNLTNLINVKVIPGGAKTIMKNFVSVSAVKAEKNVVYLLDGDQRMQNQNVINQEMRDKLTQYIIDNRINTTDIPQAENIYLGNMVKELVGCDILLYIDGNTYIGGNEEQKHRQLREFLDYWSEYVFYLPGMKPEELLYNSLKDDERQIIFGNLEFEGIDWKEYFVEKTKMDLCTSDPQSMEILFVQRQVIAKFPEDCETFELIGNIIEHYFAN